jgi:hypothetical protein
MAGELLNDPRLPEKISRFLQSSRGMFLFGNTAPDVQVVSGQPRQVTHFFNLPIQAGDQPPWELILSDHPHLANAEQLPAHQAAFLSGYLCHLQADWFWVKDIFAPIFGPRCSWSTFHKRLYYHNVLRAYLDRHILPELFPGMDICLRRVNPDGWLPFVQDHHLMEWRNLLFPQLQPGAVTQTVEVFSSRQGISAPEFYNLLESGERMQQEIFQHIPLKYVQNYRQRVLDENILLLSVYLAFTLHQTNSPIEGNDDQGVQ